MKIASNKIADVLRFFQDNLKDIYEKEELETIVAYCFEEFLGIKRSEILQRKNETMTESQLLKFNFAIKDLKRQKPIQYILGKADFYGLKFIVNEHVLIPRPETEELVDIIVKEFKVQRLKFKNSSLPDEQISNLNSRVSDLNSQFSILDIGTGSGCIPIALKKNIPEAKIYGLDISEKALDIAKQNAVLNKVEVEFILNDILDPNIQFPNSKLDIIVSNPPYIRISEKETMHKNVLEHEPHLALFVNDNDPLLFYKAIADFALKNLNPTGKLYFEINENFGFETKQMLEKKGFKNVDLIKDLNGKCRIIKAFF
ncbi:MAG: protein-(glutamine-N5) methyltransferase, release factor-specific [Bacteroidetes bacterium RIFCSPLOWO2_12_FULL_35_15]|nr:MAG: protein-(glutamine-N5) methyltransferase, release factor-specific [Bacteroidetes bacterium RIFCSPLOWO2_12_FULL_35_15]